MNYYYKRPTAEQGIARMIDHYNSEINLIFRQIGFNHDMGVRRTEKSISDTNEELYGLFMKKRDLQDILNKIDSDDQPMEKASLPATEGREESSDHAGR